MDRKYARAAPASGRSDGTSFLRPWPSSADRGTPSALDLKP